MDTEFIANPPVGSGPGILVLHAWWGLNDFMRQFCQRLANEGFVVLAPDLYHGKTAATIEQAKALRSTLKGEQVQAELSSAVRSLSAQVQAARPEIGLVGFSLGAYWALWLSVEEASLVHAVTVFYAARDLDYSAARAAYQCHLAETDPYVSASGMKKMEKRLRQASRPATFYTYTGTGHWFFEADRPDVYNPTAAELAWRRTHTFLKEQLIT